MLKIEKEPSAWEKIQDAWYAKVCATAVQIQLGIKLGEFEALKYADIWLRGIK